MDKMKAVIIKGIVSEVLKSADVQEVLEGLYLRWLDERGYEDIKTYVAVVAPVVEKIGGVTFDRMTGRPFGFVFTVALTDGTAAKFQMSVNSKGFQVQNI